MEGYFIIWKIEEVLNNLLVSQSYSIVFIVMVPCGLTNFLYGGKLGLNKIVPYKWLQ